MESLIAATENCRYCLMCRHVAPVGHVMHDEALTPHGIALVVSSQKRGLLTWNAESVAILYAEPDAGNCRAHCVTNQPLPAAIAAVRAQVAREGLAPAVAYELRDRLREQHSLFGTWQPASGRSRTVLFVGDEGHNLRPDSTAAALRLLEAAGIGAIPVGIGLSSGYFASSLGFPALAKSLASKCLDEIRAAGAGRVLVLSPQEQFTFRQLYPERLGVAWPDDVELADLSTVLAEAVNRRGLNIRSQPSPAAYVDPSHAVRVPERFDPVRLLCARLLGQPPSELFWRRERAHPVGSTALQFTRPDIAERLTRARLKDATARGAVTVICEEPATLHALEGHAEACGVTVVDLYQALAGALC